MDKNLILLKLCYKFSKKYMSSYISAIIKPILIGIAGIFLLYLVKIDTKFVLLSLLSIPCMCYAFWRGYVITYALIACANNFINSESKAFKFFVVEVKRQERTFVKYICFVALLSIVLYIPSVVIIAKIIPFSEDFIYNIQLLQEKINMVNGIFLLNSLVISPFLNFALCAYYYKKDDENYFDLFLNCYRKLNIFGLFIAVIVTWFSYTQIVPYAVLALFLNPFIYSINAFWYISRLKK